MKTAEEILSGISEGYEPNYNGKGWVEMDSGGEYYRQSDVIDAMETFANQSKWIDVSEQPTPDFDGEYLCVLEIEQECKNVWIRQAVVECIFNNWRVKSNQKVIKWQPLPTV